MQTEVTVHDYTGGSYSVLNTEELRKKHQGWVLFPGITSEDGTPLTTDFEVKFGSWKAGQEKTRRPAREEVELCVVIEGTLEFSLIDLDGVEANITLEAGQALLYRGLSHKVKAGTETRTIVVRTPCP